MGREWARVRVAFWALAFFASAAAPAGASASRPLITEPIDDSRRVTLAGNTRPEANAANDRGAVPGSLPIDHMLLLLKRPAEQEQAVDALIEQQQDPKSPNYRHWLGAAEFGARFGTAASDIATVAGWLAAHGFRIGTIYPSGMAIDFSGTAGQVRDAFHTELHRFEVGGRVHVANIADPQIPAALAAAVAGVAALNDFAPPPVSGQATFSGDCESTSVIGTCYALVPADLAKIYHLDALFRRGITGQGLTIVVVENANINAVSDWDTFNLRFGLARYGGTFQQENPAPPSGANNCSNPGAGGDVSEATLDAEWSNAAAPGATIVLASCAGSSGILTALMNVVNAATGTPDIISNSYGSCEADNGAAGNLAFAMVYQQAVMEGISVFASSGDAGSEFCVPKTTTPFTEPPGNYGIGVNGHASTPYNVAVGGTDFADTYTGTNAAYWRATNRRDGGSALSYIPEIAWNSSCASALLAQFVSGSAVTYGDSGFCNSAVGQPYLLTVGGSGGPSRCATGAPAAEGVVSGTCAGYTKPSWQKGTLGNPLDGVRDLPDVSLFAANGVWGHRFITCNTNPMLGKTCTGPLSGWAGSGGTSYASPIMAGIQALVDQSAGGRQGNPAQVYYQLAAEDYKRFGAAACNSALGTGIAKGCVFHNVTLGDNDMPCVAGPDCYLPSGSTGVVSTSTKAYRPAYPAHPGWNFATGLGSIDAANLAARWPH